MAALKTWSYREKLTSPDLNATVSELASRASAAASAAAAAQSSAAVADADALAARAAAGAADAHAGSAATAAATADAKAVAAKAAADAAAAAASVADSKAVAAASAASVADGKAVAANTAAGTAQNRADAAYALAAAGGSGSGSSGPTRPATSSFEFFGLVAGQVVGDTTNGPLSIVGVANAVQCLQGARTPIPTAPCTVRTHVKTLFSAGSGFSSGLVLGRVGENALVSFAYQRGSGLVMNQWISPVQYAGTLAISNDLALPEDGWFQAVIDTNGKVTFGFGGSCGSDYLRIGQFATNSLVVTPNAAGFFGNFPQGSSENRRGLVSLAAMSIVAGVPATY